MSDPFDIDAILSGPQADPDAIDTIEEHRVISVTHEARLKKIKKQQMKAKRLRLGYRPEEAYKIPIAEQGEYLHCILPGNHDATDLIKRYSFKTGRIEELIIATLSMSKKNAEDLVRLNPVTADFLLSDYFAKVDKETVYRDVVKELEKINARIKIIRNHCKISLIKINENYFVMEGSANLRSSSNIEQMTITNNQEVYEFHKKWITEQF
jgi:hypothetical protein